MSDARLSGRALAQAGEATTAAPSLLDALALDTKYGAPQRLDYTQYAIPGGSPVTANGPPTDIVSPGKVPAVQWQPRPTSWANEPAESPLPSQPPPGFAPPEAPAQSSASHDPAGGRPKFVPPYINPTRGVNDNQRGNDDTQHATAGRSINLITENIVRGASNIAQYRLFENSLPIPTRPTTTVIGKLMPTAHEISNKATQLSSLLDAPLQSSVNEMHRLGQSNRRLPLNWSQWEPLRGQGLNPTETAAFDRWTKMNGVKQSVDMLKDETKRVQNTQTLADLVSKDHTGQYVTRMDKMGMPPDLRKQPQIRTLMDEIRCAERQLCTTADLNIRSTEQLVAAEQRAAGMALAGAWMANASIDYMFFRDSSPSWRTYIGDIALPAGALMLNRLSWGMRFAGMVGGHVGLKLWDKLDP